MTSPAGSDRLRPVLAGVAGLVCGIGLVLGVAAVVRSAPGAETPPETTSTTVPVPVWSAAGELVLGPAVLVPGSLGTDGSTVVLPFDLVTLSPLQGIDRARISVIGAQDVEVDPMENPPVFPARWTLVTATGDLEGSVANPRSRTARFAVPDDFDPETVEAIRVDGYHLPVPISLPVALGRGAPAEIVPGVQVAVVNIVEQASGFIVQVRLEGDGATPVDRLTIEGDSAAWLSSDREAEFGNVVVLRYGGEVLPDPLDLRARGMVWMPVDDPIAFVPRLEAG